MNFKYLKLEYRNLKHLTDAIQKPIMLKTIKLLSIVSISILTVACSSSTSQIDSFELLPADSIKQGPGVFSGNNGSYTAIGTKKPSKVAKIKPASTALTTSSLEGKDLQQTSELLNEKIKQSQRNTIELELLKRQVDAKLKTY